MYCIPHILCILKTLIPTPSPRPRALVVAIDRDRKTSSHPDSPGIMSAFTVSSATAVRAPVRVAARRTAGAKIARGSVLARYTVTLETPEGAQAIECADDTYILDAAEVRATRRLARDWTRDARTRETNFFFVCASIARFTDSENRRRGARERVRIPRGVDRDRDRYPSIISRVFPVDARSVDARARAHRLTIFTRVRLFPRRAGSRHRPSVLVPRGRLLLVRGQGHGKCATRSLTSSDEP